MEPVAELGACCVQRRLLWPQLSHPESDVADDSPTPLVCGGSPGWTQDRSPGHRHYAEDSERPGCVDALLRSPTVGGAMTFKGMQRHANAEKGSTQQLAADSIPGVGLLMQQQSVLASATSSSRRSLDLMCAAAVLQLQAAVPGSTPHAAISAALPAAPRKCSVDGTVVAGRACRAPYRATRALLGMAPSSASDLQQMRDWLTSLEAR